MSEAPARPRALLAALSLGVSALLCLLVSEIALRAIDFRPRDGNPEMFVAHHHPQLFHKLRPGFEGIYNGLPVRVDRRGARAVKPAPAFRERFEALAQAPPERRVLLIGDSVVFGQGVRDHETIASQLQNLLFERDLGFRVENIGVPGYTSWNEYVALEEYFEDRGAAVVVVVYIPNDITFDDDQLEFQEGRYNVRDSFFARARQVVYTHVYTSWLLREGAVMLLRELRGSHQQVSDRFLDDAAIAHSAEALVRMRDACRARGTRFAVGIYRDAWHYRDRERSLLYEEKVFGQLRERGLDAFPLASHIEQLAPRQARAHWNDPHPSAAAAGWIARDILAHVAPWLAGG